MKAGQYVEVVREDVFQGLTLPQAKALLVERQQYFQSEVTADAGWNPWKYYGTRWNGSAWTNAGVD
jgi:hypothetical protein